MLKKFTPYAVYFALSIAVVILTKYVNDIIVALVNLYDYIDDHLEVMFNQSPAGILSRNTLSLVVCPLIISGIPALLYYAIKKTKMPYFLEATWLAWIVIVLGNSIVK